MKRTARWMLPVVAMAVLFTQVQGDEAKTTEVFQHVKAVRYATAHDGVVKSAEVLAREIPGMDEVTKAFERWAATQNLKVTGYIANERKGDADRELSFITKDPKAPLKFQTIPKDVIAIVTGASAPIQLTTAAEMVAYCHDFNYTVTAPVALAQGDPALRDSLFVALAKHTYALNGGLAVKEARTSPIDVGDNFMVDLIRPMKPALNTVSQVGR